MFVHSAHGQNALPASSHASSLLHDMIYDFSVLRTLEIATPIRIPDFRPSCSCLFARQIITQLRLLAGMLCNCLPGLFTHYITCFGALYTGQTASVARFFIIFNSF